MREPSHTPLGEIFKYITQKLRLGKRFGSLQEAFHLCVYTLELAISSSVVPTGPYIAGICKFIQLGKFLSITYIQHILHFEILMGVLRGVYFFHGSQERNLACLTLLRNELVSYSESNSNSRSSKENS